MGPVHALDEDPGHAGSFKCGNGNANTNLAHMLEECKSC